MIKTKYNSEFFYEYKDHRDKSIENNFKENFQNILNLYKSLSTLNNYKKIQKVSIIQVPASNDVILNLLNKITEVNYERISQKLLLKLTESNGLTFIQQILIYSKQANTNSTLLWKLINLIYKEYIKLCPTRNEHIKIEIVNNIENYISEFLNNINIDIFVLNFCDNDNITLNEKYHEFVERNTNNSSLFAQMKMLCTILDKNKNFHLLYKLEELFDILVLQLKQCLENVKHLEYIDNITNIILECLLIFINFKRFTKDNITTYKSFLMDFEVNNFKDKLSNKNKFKVMDIIDLLKKKVDKF